MHWFDSISSGLKSMPSIEVGTVLFPVNDSRNGMGECGTSREGLEFSAIPFRMQPRNRLDGDRPGARGRGIRTGDVGGLGPAGEAHIPFTVKTRRRSRGIRTCMGLFLSSSVFGL